MIKQMSFLHIILKNVIIRHYTSDFQSFFFTVDPLLLTVIQNFESCGPSDIFCGPLRGPWTPGWEPLYYTENKVIAK